MGRQASRIIHLVCCAVLVQRAEKGESYRSQEEAETLWSLGLDFGRRMGGTIVGRHSSHGNGATETLSVVMIIVTIEMDKESMGPDCFQAMIKRPCGCNPSTQEAEMGELPQI